MKTTIISGNCARVDSTLADWYLSSDENGNCTAITLPLNWFDATLEFPMNTNDQVNRFFDMLESQERMCKIAYQQYVWLMSQKYTIAAAYDVIRWYGHEYASYCENRYENECYIMLRSPMLPEKSNQGF